MEKLGRRTLLVTAAVAGCARRIPTSPDVTSELRSDWTVVVPAPPVNGSVAVHLKQGSRNIGFGVLVANLGEKLLAFDRDCPHAGCELTWVAEDREVECPCHGSRFTSDGQVLHPPAVTDLHTYPVTLDASGNAVVHIYPGDGTYPAPDASRKLTLDLASYPQLAQVNGYVFGFVEGPPGALIVMRVSDTAYAAIDAVCTHQFCTVRPKADGVLHCPCHGSEFASDGHVLKSPANFPLTTYPATASGGQLLIDLS